MTPLLWTKGYSAAELDRAQEKFDLVFPPDLLTLLRDRRPVGGHDWTNEGTIRRALNWPFESLLFDIEHNKFWLAEWGEKPVRAQAREEVLRLAISRAPGLIPLISHRYLPDEPSEAGNPVFSVYQSDIIYYGANLEDYFAREGSPPNTLPWPREIRHISFWSDLVERNNLEA